MFPFVLSLFSCGTSERWKPLGGGTATFSTSSLAIGVYVMIARYDGDAHFSPSSTSTVLSQAVSQATTNIALSSSPNPAAVNQAVQLTASVAVAAPGAGTPTGFVQFWVGKLKLGQPVAVNASGVATTSFFSRASGRDSLSVQYLGDSNFTGSVSKNLTQVTQ